MYVQVVVETPQKLTKRQRELLAEFERLSSRRRSPKSSGFFGKVKEFLDGLGPAAPIPRKPPRSGPRRLVFSSECSKMAVFRRVRLPCRLRPCSTFEREDRAAIAAPRAEEDYHRAQDRTAHPAVRAVAATISARRSKIRSGNSSARAASGSTTRCASSVPGSSGRCDRRGHAVEQDARARHGALCRSA